MATLTHAPLCLLMLLVTAASFATVEDEVSLLQVGQLTNLKTQVSAAQVQMAEKKLRWSMAELARALRSSMPHEDGHLDMSNMQALVGQAREQLLQEAQQMPYGVLADLMANYAKSAPDSVLLAPFETDTDSDGPEETPLQPAVIHRHGASQDPAQLLGHTSTLREAMAAGDEPSPAHHGNSDKSKWPGWGGGWGGGWGPGAGLYGPGAGWGPGMYGPGAWGGGLGGLPWWAWDKSGKHQKDHKAGKNVGLESLGTSHAESADADADDAAQADSDSDADADADAAADAAAYADAAAAEDAKAAVDGVAAEDARADAAAVDAADDAAELDAESAAIAAAAAQDADAQAASDAEAAAAADGAAAEAAAEAGDPADAEVLLGDADADAGHAADEAHEETAQQDLHKAMDSMSNEMNALGSLVGDDAAKQILGSIFHSAIKQTGLFGSDAAALNSEADAEDAEAADMDAEDADAEVSDDDFVGEDTNQEDEGPLPESFFDTIEATLKKADDGRDMVAKALAQADADQIGAADAVTQTDLQQSLDAMKLAEETLSRSDDDKQFVEDALLKAESEAQTSVTSIEEALKQAETDQQMIEDVVGKSDRERKQSALDDADAMMRKADQTQRMVQDAVDKDAGANIQRSFDDADMVEAALDKEPSTHPEQTIQDTLDKAMDADVVEEALRQNPSTHPDKDIEATSIPKLLKRAADAQDIVNDALQRVDNSDDQVDHQANMDSLQTSLEFEHPHKARKHKKQDADANKDQMPKDGFDLGRKFAEQVLGSIFKNSPLVKQLGSHLPVAQKSQKSQKRNKDGSLGKRPAPLGMEDFAKPLAKEMQPLRRAAPTAPVHMIGKVAGSSSSKSSETRTENGKRITTEKICQDGHCQTTVTTEDA